MKVKFSIITPTFNRAASGFLRECIISVREQTRGNYEYEHVIVDDGSTDETEKYIKSLKDNNIQYIYQKNAGTASATRTGINATNGDYIIILDDDDLLMEDSLKKRLQFIEKNPKVDFFYGNAQWIDKNGFLIKPLFNSKYYNDHQYERLLIENYINAGTPTAKSWLYKDIKWPSWLERSQDYFMWLEVFRPERKTKIGYLDELLVKYRWHQTAYTSAIHGDKEKIKEKELLNLKIKKLHPDNMVFMADQAKQKITEINRINENFQEETSELTRQLFLTREELGWFRMSRAIKVALKIRKSVRGAKDKAKMMPRIFISRTWMFLPASLRKTLKSILKKKTKTKIVDKDKWPAGEPLVSVVTPFYNHGETLPSTIDSVLNQTFQNFEYIIVNDGSNDEFSVNVIKSIKHPKIQVINQVNKGKGSPAAARNVGIKKAKGKYIMCLDADDMIDPTFIEKAVSIMESDPMISVVGCNMKTYGVVERVYNFGPYDAKTMLSHNSVCTPALFRREAWEKTGGYKGGIGYEDWEFWVNLAENGCWGRNIGENLLNYKTVLSSRYTSDQADHGSHIKKIRELHPNYKEEVRKLKRIREKNNISYEYKERFTNLDSPNYFLQPDNRNKNILIAIPWMPFGGAETLIYNFTKEIKDDYNISFVTGLVGENEWEYKFKEITPNIYHLHNLFGQDKKMYLEFISNYIKTRNIDILHIIHTNYVFEMLPELKRKHPNLKVIVTMFNDKVQYFGESLKLEKVVDYYSTDNNQVRDSYKKSLEINKNIKVIPNGIDGEKNFNSALYDKEEVRNRLRLEENDKAVFFVGRLSKEKNPDIFVETAKKFVADKHLKFFIIGDGPMKNEIEKSLEDKKIHNIKYLGYKKPEEVAEYLTVCDIFVLPSAIEGFPLSILEAMAMKTAVIASRIGAMPDILKDGYTGFVVTPGSSEEIAQRIQKIYKDNVRLNTIKNNARKDFEEKYSNKILKKNYEAFYRELLS